MDINILLVCDVRLYREGLRGALNARPGIHVAGTAGNASQTLEQAAACGPDVVLLEMGVPDAPKLIARLLETHPRLKVVALGITEDPTAVLACAEAGASGYVTRDASIDVLLDTLHATPRGDVICSPQVAATLFHRVAALAADHPGAGVDGGLTIREREIVGLIDEGLSNKEIAHRLATCRFRS